MSGFLIGPCGVAPAASGTFSPSSLTSLVGWWKADVGTFSDTGGTTPSTNGTAVKFWQDQSGVGNHLISGATQVAVLTTNSLNSLPVLVFSGVASQPPQASIALSDASHLSCFLVMTHTSAGANDRIISMKGNGAGDDASSLNSGCLILPSLGNVGFFEVSQVASGAMTASTYNQVGFTTDGTTVTLYEANSSLGSGARATSFSTPVLFGAGGIVTSGSSGLNGGIAEIILMNALATTTERNNIQTYLFGRYGV